MTDTVFSSLSAPVAATAGLLAQAGQPAKAAAEAAEATGAGGWLVLAAVVAVLGLPFLLGWLIAKGLRMPDVLGRIGLVLLALAIGIAPFAFNIARTGSFREGFRESIRLGIDLAGGTNLVYQVEPGEKELNDQVLDNMVGSVNQRINPSGVEEVTVRRVGRDRIEVIVPGAEPEKVRQIKANIVKLGSLEFAILANARDHAAIIERARQLLGSERDVRQGGRIVASWKNVAREQVPAGENRVGDWKESGEAERYVNRQNEIVQPPAGPTGEVDKQILVILDRPERRVTGEYLRTASPIRDESGQPAVSFNFYPQGGRLFSILTSANRPAQDGFKRRLSILLNDEIHSAPSINSVISSQGQITGSFTEEEVRGLVDVLNAGALEVPLDPAPVSEYTISPLLGEDTVGKALTAMAWAGLFVVLVTVLYYLKAGLIAVVCLALNLVLLLGAMSFIDATFTLPGLAGIVLAVGMAVDTNVLIFERMREELERGSSHRIAIQNGFHRALSAIIDSNVTTLITAVILFMIGTDAVRGFAVTLFIGIVLSMFTALYVGRLIFDVLERKRWLGKLRMNRLFAHPNIDFLGKMKPFIIGSIVLIALGLGMLFARGRAMLDIDFLGGTMVTFQLEDPASIPQVRETLEKVPQFEGNVSVERLVLRNEPPGEQGRRFRVRTTMRDSEPDAGRADDAIAPVETEGPTPGNARQTVAGLIAAAFEESPLDIRRVTVTPGPIEPIPGGEGAEAAEGSFAGGHQVTLTFEEGDEPAELTTDTAATYVADRLGEIGPGGAPKYDRPAGLLRVIGTEGSGTKAEQTELQTFSTVRVEVSPDVARADLETALADLQTRMAESPVFDEVNSFDSSVASEMQQSALLAIAASWLAIIGYLWFRFQDISYGFAAVIALAHDVLITLGIVALASYVAGPLGLNVLGLEEFKFNLPMVAAVLTLIGYSINDTIVVFDRVREVRGKSPVLTRAMLNTSLNQTLSRTLLTSTTTLIVTTVLYFFGGEGIHGFSFILTIGIIIGTFSSIYVASPALLWLTSRKASRPATPTPAVRETAAR